MDGQVNLTYDELLADVQDRNGNFGMIRLTYLVKILGKTALVPVPGTLLPQIIEMILVDRIFHNRRTQDVDNTTKSA
jgi:hypothetical protein